MHFYQRFNPVARAQRDIEALQEKLRDETARANRAERRLRVAESDTLAMQGVVADINRARREIELELDKTNKRLYQEG